MSGKSAFDPRFGPWTLDEPGAPAARACEWPGCDCDGDYRAPKSPDDLRSFRWFCLDHVRGYNRAWDYFKGMGEIEIEEVHKRDTVWHRPSWPLGSRAAGAGAERAHIPGDFGFFDGAWHAPPPLRDDKRDEALAELGLDRTAEAADIKARYKCLVKKHHPDANGGSKVSEEKFKTINQAYTYLRNRQNA